MEKKPLSVDHLVQSRVGSRVHCTANGLPPRRVEHNLPIQRGFDRRLTTVLQQRPPVVAGGEAACVLPAL